MKSYQHLCPVTFTSGKTRRSGIKRIGERDFSNLRKETKLTSQLRRGGNSYGQFESRSSVAPACRVRRKYKLPERSEFVFWPATYLMLATYLTDTKGNYILAINFIVDHQISGLM
jgi:hypothetical protein